MIKFEGSNICRYGILRRDSNNADEIRWFTIPTHYCFHYLNSYEDQSKNGDPIIVLSGLVYPWVSMEWDAIKEHLFEDSRNEEMNANFTKFVFNLRTGEAQ